MGEEERRQEIMGIYKKGVLFQNFLYVAVGRTTDKVRKIEVNFAGTSPSVQTWKILIRKHCNPFVYTRHFLFLIPFAIIKKNYG